MLTIAWRINVPADRESEEYDLWESKLTYNLFIEKRAQSFQHMWRWRIFVLRVKLERGLLPKQISPGGQVQSTSRNQNAGGDVVHADHSMEDVM